MSGDPHSPHSSDLHQDWIEGVYRPLHFLEADVAAHTLEESTIAP
jgi:acyl-homoserine lactone acylase PvdQ